MQQAFDRVRPAFNDNLPTPLADALAASRQSLWRFEIPDASARNAVAGAFAQFRQALLFQLESADAHGLRTLAACRAVEEARAELAAVPCADGYDFAMKALAGNALVFHCAAHAAAAQSAAQMIGDAEGIADFMAHLAADAMGLGAMPCGEVRA